jgi:MFS family permease
MNIRLKISLYFTAIFVGIAVSFPLFGWVFTFLDKESDWNLHHRLAVGISAGLLFAYYMLRSRIKYKAMHPAVFEFIPTDSKRGKFLFFISIFIYAAVAYILFFRFAVSAWKESNWDLQKEIVTGIIAGYIFATNLTRLKIKHNLFKPSP